MTQAALHSEYNTLGIIHDLLSDLPTPPDISHVKGNQVDKVPYEELPLPAQLNIDTLTPMLSWHWRETS
jgi:hypothetical protein